MPYETISLSRDRLQAPPKIPAALMSHLTTFLATFAAPRATSEMEYGYPGIFV